MQYFLIMKIEVIKYDGLNAFGAFCKDSVKNGSGIILIDTQTIFKDGELIFEDGSTVIMDSEEKKRVLIETMMHEFGHALEELFNTEFEEDFIEQITMSYKHP